ncbi:MAG: hypothetical protein HYY93_12350 [Planctomycetes bacterium]|nr:hypothetical protein [Planctomycetota bacterium]
MSIRHKTFRFPRNIAWEMACKNVEDWINANLPPESVISINIEDNEQGGAQDFVVVWYRETVSPSDPTRKL